MKSKRCLPLCSQTIVVFVVLVACIASGAIPLHAQGSAFVTNQCDNTVSVVEIKTNAVIATIPTGVFPTRITIPPNGAHAYLTNQTSSGFVSVIDTATDAVVATIPVGGNPFEVAITQSGKFAYVANENDNSVSVIDTKT